MNFKDNDEYQQWVTSDKRPKNIPLEPRAYYVHGLGHEHYSNSNTDISPDNDNAWYSWDVYLGLR